MYPKLAVTGTGTPKSKAVRLEFYKAVLREVLEVALEEVIASLRYWRHFLSCVVRESLFFKFSIEKDTKEQ